uniref:Peroniin-1.1 n=1 Tax=Litoria peronii TaxID=317363 RepID=PE11_LITPE|nr:RecName: Full=Peroniin-1.1 [Litoria peronii]
QPWLPFG